MLQALIKKKLARLADETTPDLEIATSREGALSSTVFGLLRYPPPALRWKILLEQVEHLPACNVVPPRIPSSAPPPNSWRQEVAT